MDEIARHMFSARGTIRDWDQLWDQLFEGPKKDDSGVVYKVDVDWDMIRDQYGKAAKEAVTDAAIQFVKMVLDKRFNGDAVNDHTNYYDFYARNGRLTFEAPRLMEDAFKVKPEKCKTEAEADDVLVMALESIFPGIQERLWGDVDELFYRPMRKYIASHRNEICKRSNIGRVRKLYDYIGDCMGLKSPGRGLR